MGNYRFTKKEVEEMKKTILTVIKCEDAENKTAWRLRSSLEMRAYCCKCNKKEKAKNIRVLTLYVSLTKNDMPNF